MSNTSISREGVAEVPGASLRYRLTGTPSKLPTIVLENGWGASYDYFSLFQKALAPHTQLLLYNRAGIGGSVAHEPQSVEGMSQHLVALLDILGIKDKVVVAGQSYGGLICGVHAALIPQRLQAIVQIDPTAERADPKIDATLGVVRKLGQLMVLMAKLRIPEPFFAKSMKEVPMVDVENVSRYSFGNAASMKAAITEMDLLPQIRETCAKDSTVPRLVISADESEAVRSAVLNWLVPPERARALLINMQAQHEITAKRGGKNSQWIKLPHTHGGLVTQRAGAADTAARLINFASALAGTA